MKKIFYILLIIILMIISFILGFYLRQTEVVVSENKVYFNGELQTFRTLDGHKLSLIEYNGNIYIPITEKGLFIGKSVEVDKDKIDITDYNIDEDKIIEIDTETLDGVHFSNENLYSYDYTLLLNWTVWCPDCDLLLDNLSENSEWFKENNVQIVGIPYEDFTENEIDKILKIKQKLKEKKLDFVNIKSNSNIEDVFQSNIFNIPSVVVLDDKGRIKYRDDKVDILVEELLKEIDSIEDCGDC